MSEKAAKEIIDARKGHADEAKAASKASPTGKDIPNLAVDEIEGENTAVRPGTAPGKGNSAAQTEPALRVAKKESNRDQGTIPHGHVSTPGGLVPASAVGGAEALARYEDSIKESIHDGESPTRERHLDDETISKMSGPELRHLANVRGYEISSDAGTNTTRREFAEQQSRDKNFKKSEK